MRPHDLKTSGAHMRDDVPGAKASTPLIGAYIEALKTHVAGRLQTYKHLSLLQDYRMFTGENRTERDLTVAAGFALLLGRKVDRIRKVNANKRWSNLPFNLYNKHGKPVSVQQ